MQNYLKTSITICRCKTTW